MASGRVAVRCRDSNLGPASNPLPTEQDQAVDDEEPGGGQGLREDHAQRVLEEQADDPGRDRRDDQQPAQALVGCLESLRPD